MHDTIQDRAIFASRALVCLAIAFGTLSFWSDALAAGDLFSAPIDWLVAALLTVAMLSVSTLLSGSVIRFAVARERDAPVTAGLVVIFGAVLTLIEGGMTHEGLAWLDARKDLAPGWLLVVASFGLSGFNVFALYTFGRDIPKPKPTTAALPSTEEKPATAAGRKLANERWKPAA